MSELHPDHQSEFGAHAVVGLPAVELFHNPGKAAETWPEIAADLDFWISLEVHAEQARNINGYLDKIPSPAITPKEAIDKGLVNEQDTENFYFNLASILSNQDNYRLVLYMPFEFIPEDEWAPENKALANAVDLFKENYMMAWVNLLKVLDARANFVDGDVLEPELRQADLPRVVKSAQLAPKLVEVGLLSTSDVITLLEDAYEDSLNHDLTDSLRVMAEMGQVSDEDIERMHQSRDYMARYAAILIDADRDKSADAPKPEVETTYLGVLQELSNIPEVGVNSRVTPRRADWLRQKQIDDTVTSLADRLGRQFLDGTTALHELQALGSIGNTLSSQVFVETALKIVETAAITGQQDTDWLYMNFKGQLAELWVLEDEAVQTRLTRAFRHFHKLGILADDQLADIGVEVSDLSSPLSGNLERIQQVEKLKNVIDLVEKDDELAAMIYPVIMVGGSRLKGYGDPSSDLDLGIFIKPGVSEDAKHQVRHLVATKLQAEGIPEQPMEFWLERTSDKALAVRDLDKYDTYTADKYWTHMLFQTGWIGQPEAIQELRGQLLANYFKDDDKRARAMYLERLEQDLLQYRLMHKGYERHYPVNPALTGDHADLLDGNSAFWDPGYRRLATRLFINNVFLPKVS